MKANEVREKYLKFFKSAPRNHKEISAAPLVLEGDPTTLFTSSGMQPLVPYLLGEEHPDGKRLVNSQPSIRTQDIEEVGDNRHTTFFEMLGNWSLGDYFKKEQLNWFLEFLVDELKLDPKKLYVTVFSGDKEFGVARDEESIEIWQSLYKKYGIEAKYKELGSESTAGKEGMGNARIFGYEAKKNWWSRNGTPQQMPVGDIGGPDSEVFYDFGEERKIHENSVFKNFKCHPNCDCGRFLEIGNSVFMQYKKVGEGKLEELPNKNVDFGGGFERLVAATLNDPDVFNIDIFADLIRDIEIQVKKRYSEDQSSFRIIVDHIRGATFLASSGVVPSNKQQGYVMRRLIRRAVVKARKLKEGIIEPSIFTNLVSDIIKSYPVSYLDQSKEKIFHGIIFDEVNKFAKTLEKGFREVNKISVIDGKSAFDLYQTYGFPLEITLELFKEKGQNLNPKEFEKEFEKHKEKSRTASAGTFKGGLADTSEDTVKMHTATHLLHWALRQTLGEQVIQRGSNITAERLRFDFNHDEKLSDTQIKKITDLINEKVAESLPVNFEVMDRKKAEATGAIHAFGEKYGDEVKIYYIGQDLDSAISKEFCGGPHVEKTSEIGHVTISRQKKIGTGLMRIYAVIEQ